jgi:hypothetical protein
MSTRVAGSCALPPLSVPPPDVRPPESPPPPDLFPEVDVPDFVPGLTGFTLSLACAHAAVSMVSSAITRFMHPSLWSRRARTATVGGRHCRRHPQVAGWGHGDGRGAQPEVAQARTTRDRLTFSPMPLPESRCKVSINLNSISPNADVNIIERRAFASNLRLLIFELVLSIIIRANSKRHSLRQSSEAVGVVPFQTGQGVLSHETTSQARRRVSSRRWTSARRVFRRRIR